MGLFEGGADAAAAMRTRGLGALACLPDEALLNILHELAPADLARLACVSRALWAFANHDELWKGFCLDELEGKWDFQGNWQDTYLLGMQAKGFTPGTRKMRRAAGLQSDLLYTPWLCATCAIDPSWLEVDNVDRRSGLSVAEFREQYEIPNKPVILTDVVTKWPAMKKWSRAYLKKAFKGGMVLVGDQPIPFDSYCKYADTNTDELPLYLFDKTFCETAPKLAQDYTVPEVFSDDLFKLLGDARPDWRWLIAGPYKSGSGWHKDPNSTSAWNGVVSGRKKWILYPPHITPPGVRPSCDGADVASPVSIMEWFMSFYEHKESVGYTPAECILKEGEIMFVPRNWWHIVLNLDECVAVTQNFVSEVTLPHVLSHLRSRSPALVSGCAKEARSGMYDRFVQALKEHRPELLERVAAEEAAKKKRAEEQHKLAGLFKEPDEACNGGSLANGSAAANGSSTANGAANPEANGSTAAAQNGSAAGGGGGFSFGFKL